VHAAVLVVLARVLIVPMAIRDFLSVEGARRAPQERITYIQPPRSEPAQRGRSGGDGRPIVQRQDRAAPAPPLVAPTDVPTTLPPAADSARPLPEPGGSGPIIGKGGPVRGLEPSYNDPRVWGGPSIKVTIAAEPKTPSQRLDSALKSRVAGFNDSVVANTYVASKFERGDWTVGEGDSKWGIDPQFIRLGKISIPTALLGLLPMNQQGNPIAYERERNLAAARADIQYHAARAMNEEEFRKAVRALRERKERERAREAQKPPVANPDAPKFVP
jgi:hypothetical protein